MSSRARYRSIGVVGAGAYGTALALAAARAGHAVRLWARDGETIGAIERTRQAPRLPGIDLPESIHATELLAALADCDAVILAVPTQALRSACEHLAEALPPRVPVISAAKGIEQASGRFATEIIEQAWPGEFIGGRIGLGASIIAAQSVMDSSLIFALFIVITALGMLLYEAVRLIERRVLHRFSKG